MHMCCEAATAKRQLVDITHKSQKCDSSSLVDMRNNFISAADISHIVIFHIAHHEAHKHKHASSEARMMEGWMLAASLGQNV